MATPECGRAHRSHALKDIPPAGCRHGPSDDTAFPFLYQSGLAAAGIVVVSEIRLFGQRRLSSRTTPLLLPEPRLPLQSVQMPTLFDPLLLGSVHLPNRIVMAPLTRLRAGAPVHVPNRLMAEYYAQRADAGLIITEGVPVSPQAVGYLNVPGIWTSEQVAGWRLVTHAVHAAGGRIFMQLWHVGRISDPAHLRGDLPVAPSALAAPGHVSLLAAATPLRRPTQLGTRRDPGCHRGVSVSCAEREGGGVRRRDPSRRQRLPARPVPAGRHQPSDRWLRREPGTPRKADARGDRCRRECVGRGQGRNAPRDALPESRGVRQSSGDHVPLRGSRTRKAQACLPLRPGDPRARCAPGETQESIRRCRDRE